MTIQINSAPGGGLTGAGATPIELFGANPGVSIIDPGTVLRRLWYFDGKFLRAEGFRLDQEYVRSLNRLSNQAIGHGVVHGFDVGLGSGDRLTIEGGLALAPNGDVIHLPGGIDLSIAQLIDRTSGTSDGASDGSGGNAEFAPCPADDAKGNLEEVIVVGAHTVEASALGAGMLAAAGAGLFPSIEDAAAAMCGETTSIEPNPEAGERYAALLDIYQTLFAATRDVNRRLVAFAAGDA